MHCGILCRRILTEFKIAAPADFFSQGDFNIPALYAGIKFYTKLAFSKSSQIFGFLAYFENVDKIKINDIFNS